LQLETISTQNSPILNPVKSGSTCNCEVLHATQPAQCNNTAGRQTNASLHVTYRQYAEMKSLQHITQVSACHSKRTSATEIRCQRAYYNVREYHCATALSCTYHPVAAAWETSTGTQQNTATLLACTSQPAGSSSGSANIASGNYCSCTAALSQGQPRC
jgi:hypothetical protein